MTCRDALEHVCRIHRMLLQPRGNALLVGVGGSGRKSLTRLAAYVTGITCFTIEISKKYRLTDFREDLKKLYRQVSQTRYSNDVCHFQLGLQCA